MHQNTPVIDIKTDDMYLAQCQEEKRMPDRQIKEHFWKNCVEANEYAPRFCAGDDKLIKD